MDNLMLIAVLSMAGLSILFASILAFADKKLRVNEDPRIVIVYKMLPHADCGACGHVNCHNFAEQIITQGEDPGKCPVMGEEAREKLFNFLGKEEGDKYPVIAIVHCAAETENKKPVAEYSGIRTCRAAHLAFGGGMECEYGCMGFGDCTEVCPFDAIHMSKGLPRVDIKKCTGCGKCVEACPRGIIQLAEKRYEQIFYVACSSHDPILRVKQICPVGCIACGVCEKLSPEGFFKVTDNLSRADFSKQGGKLEEIQIQTIAEKCPTKVIKET